MTHRCPNFAAWCSIRLLLMALAFSLVVPVLASSAPWQSLRPVGQGEMSWLWFKLYDATF